MSIFGKIKDAIFGHPSAGAASGSPQSPAHAEATPSIATSPSSPTTGTVDVAAVLDSAVESKGQDLNWKTSIVDLMKALDLDSSLAARKELASDLKYSGDMSDSATMNIWLHKQVMTKLAENGGKVPQSLRT